MRKQKHFVRIEKRIEFAFYNLFLSFDVAHSKSCRSNVTRLSFHCLTLSFVPKKREKTFYFKKKNETKRNEFDRVLHFLFAEQSHRSRFLGVLKNRQKIFSRRTKIKMENRLFSLEVISHRLVILKIEWKTMFDDEKTKEEETTLIDRSDLFVQCFDTWVKRRSSVS